MKTLAEANSNKVSPLKSAFIGMAMAGGAIALVVGLLALLAFVTR